MLHRLCDMEGCEELDDKLELVLSGRQYRKYQELFYSAVLEKYALNMVDLWVLLFLSEHETLDTARDIVAMRYLTKSHVSKAVDKLTERGFLESKHISEDRRFIHLSLQEKAVPVIEAVHSKQKKMFQNMFAGVSEEEMVVLQHVAKVISGNIADFLKEGERALPEMRED